MEKLGEIKAILNGDYILISSNQPLIASENIDIFSVISVPELEKEIGLGNIVLPKGKIKIVCSETEGIYLAKRYRETIEKRKVITEPNIYRNVLSNYLSASAFTPQKKEVIDTTYGPWSANFDIEQSLNLTIESSPIAKIGDLVGRISK